MTDEKAIRRFRFGPFELDTSLGELRRDAIKLPIRGQPLQVLELLVRSRGELVTREALRQALWSDGTIVNFDDGLNHSVRDLRRELADPAETPTYIETIPRRGYRFLAEVTPFADPRESAPPSAAPVALDEPPVRLAPGTRVGPYEVMSLLGAGGMAEVYRAKDTRLGRDVALKVIAELVPADGPLLERFEHEARLAGSLNHPNVAALYDVGLYDGKPYLVTELLQGETLRERMSRGPIPLATALEWAVQMAQGLSAAHERGIVHRDLKPENVFVTRDGHVKLIDFGIAKLTESAREATSHGLMSKTLSSGASTGTGMVLGTPGHLSPEQLQGGKVDARSDFFGFGATMYEMVSRRRAFASGGVVETSYAILHAEPEPLPESIPVSLASVVRRCLEKDPAKRFQSAQDLAFNLELLRTATGPAVATAVSRGVRAAPERRRTRWLPWAIALVAVSAATAAMLRPGPDWASLGRPIRFSLAPPVDGTFYTSPEDTTFAVSPDGSQLVFIAATPKAGQRLWLRRFTDADARPLPNTEGARSVFWSPDGRSVGFFSGDMLKRIDLPDGAPVTICHVQTGFGHSGTWGKGGDILFAPESGESIMRVSAAGGTPSIAVRQDAAREETVRWPWFLPDGETFLYLARRGGNHSLIMAAPGRSPQELMPVASKVQFSEPGLLIFVRDGALLARRFDWRSGRLTGAPFAVAHGVRNFVTTGSADFATSGNGTLVWESSEDAQRLVWLDRSGREIGTLSERGKYLDVTFSPTGRRVAFSRMMESLGTFDVWSSEVDHGVEARITSGLSNEMHPVWLPGEKAIVYAAQHGGRPHLVHRDLETGKDTEVLPAGNWQLAEDVSPDGRLLAYTEYLESGPVSKVLVLGAGGSSAVLPSTFGMGAVRFSPDGKYIAFIADESGTAEVYITPYPGPGAKTRVSSGGVEELRWNRGTDELFYSSPDRRLWVVPVRTKPTLRVGIPTALFTTNGKAQWFGFDVTPDGKRILAIVPQTVAGQLPMAVLVNWPATAP